MKFILHHIEQIIKEYPGHPPLAAYLKNYFRSYPGLGSRDRRAISEATFIYYRCAGFFPHETGPLEIISEGLSLCKSENLFLKNIFSKNGIAGPVNSEKKDLVYQRHFLELSPDMNRKDWIRSMLQQPEVFIRIRKNKEQVFSVLNQSQIPFRIIDTNIAGDKDILFYKKNICVSLPGNSKLDTLFSPVNYVVQDWASQCSMAIGGKFWNEYRELPSALVWDVCAGSGGKSLFWKDKYPGHQVLASDIRKSILHNLKERMDRYTISGVKTCVMDATQEAEVKQKTGPEQFDAIICDVPCSGSGTWSRTPERLYFFKPGHLEKFRQLQLPIALNAQDRLKTGGLLFYITCSVFSDENEQVVEQLLKQTSLKLLHQQLINGAMERADSLFIAVFRQ